MKAFCKGAVGLLLVCGLTPGTMVSGATKQDTEVVSIAPQRQLSHPQGINVANLLHTSVTSSEGEDLGKLTDLILDLRTGEIVFAVVQNGGFLGIGGRLVPVPWHLVTLMSGNELVASVDADTIKLAPTTDRAYARLANPGFVVAVKDYFSHGSMGGAESP